MGKSDLDRAKSDLDRALEGALKELFLRFEANLPPNAGAILIAYTRESTALDVSGLVTNDAVGQYLRVLEAAKAFAVHRNRVGNATTYAPPLSSRLKFPNLARDLTISQITADELVDGSEVLRIWSHDELVGELIVPRGAGAKLATRHSLVPILAPELEPAPPPPDWPGDVADLAPFRDLARNLAWLSIGPEPTTARAINMLCDEVERLRAGHEVPPEVVLTMIDPTLDGGPATEWHTIGDYEVSFDRRLHAARFIILRGPGKVVAQGLIEHHATRGACARAIFDREPNADAELAPVTMAMLTLYERMCVQLRAARVRT